MSEAAQPIIIKRVHKGAHGHHGGAWKVAYADMVTALMALFIVLWILGQSVEVRQAVSGYFNDPAGFNESAAHTLEGGKESSPSLRSSPTHRRRLRRARRPMRRRRARASAKAAAPSGAGARRPRRSATRSSDARVRALPRPDRALDHAGRSAREPDRQPGVAALQAAARTISTRTRASSSRRWAHSSAACPTRSCSRATPTPAASASART